MNNLLTKLKLVIEKIGCFFPTKLPIGMTEFDAWAASIIRCYGLPDNDSTKFALGTAVLHASPDSGVEINLLLIKVKIATGAYRSKNFFGQQMRKGAANQIAAGIMQELKEKQKREQAEAANGQQQS